MYLLIILQSTHNYEDLGLKSAMAVVILTLSGLCRFLYIEKKDIIKDLKAEHRIEILAKDSLIKEKEEKIDKVIEDHKSDLKESGNDYKILAEKHYSFLDQLKNVVARKN